MRLVVSGAARGDLKNIARYTTREWGAAQKAKYLDAIKARFGLLLTRPRTGAPREEIAPGLRSTPVGMHLIFYCIGKGEVVILRVLHQRMDVRLHL